MSPQEADVWLAGQATEMEALVVRWAELPSGSDNPAGLAAQLAALEAEFNPIAECSERLPLDGAPCPALSCRRGGTSGRSVLLSGHFDTVYEAGHPFQSCDRPAPGRLRGPGVADMKGGIVVLLFALRAFERTALARSLGWEVLLTPDEETGSRASRPRLEQAARRHQLGLVFEPATSGGDLVRGRMGTGTIRLTCHGKAAHAGRAKTEGRNAILHLAQLLPEVDALPDGIPATLLNIGAISGGGVLNIVPELAVADLNIRAADGTAAAALQLALQELAERASRDGFRVTATGGFNRPPKQVGSREEELFARLQRIAKSLDLDLGWRDVGGGSDGNLLAAAGLPTLDGLGVRGGALHSSEEFLETDSLTERARLAFHLLCDLASETSEAPCMC